MNYKLSKTDDPIIGTHTFRAKHSLCIPQTLKIVHNTQYWRYFLVDNQIVSFWFSQYFLGRPVLTVPHFFFFFFGMMHLFWHYWKFIFILFCSQFNKTKINIVYSWFAVRWFCWRKKTFSGSNNTNKARKCFQNFPNQIKIFDFFVVCFIN